MGFNVEYGETVQDHKDVFFFVVFISFSFNLQ